MGPQANFRGRRVINNNMDQALPQPVGGIIREFKQKKFSNQYKSAENIERINPLNNIQTRKPMLPVIKQKRQNKNAVGEKPKKKVKDTVPNELFDKDLPMNRNRTPPPNYTQDLKNYQIKKDYVNSPSQSEDEYLKSKKMGSSNSRHLGNSSDYLKLDRHNSSLNRSKLRNSLSGSNSTLSKYKIVQKFITRNSNQDNEPMDTK